MACMLGVVAGDASAGGFELRQQSAAGLGRAFAGETAGGENHGAMFANPAAALHGDGGVASLSRLDVDSRLDGADWGVGFTLGAVLEPAQGTRIGAVYRSRVRHRINGRAAFVDDPAGVAAGLRAATGMFADGGFESGLTTPDRASVGIRQDLGGGASASAEAQWTNWRVMRETRVRFDSPAQPDDVVERNWRSGWYLAAGLDWRIDPAWTLRAGFAYDRSPVPGATRGVRIPDADRVVVSLGAGWRPLDGIAVDAGWSRMSMPEVGIRIDGSAPENAARGGLSARSDSEVDVFGLQIRVDF